MNSIRGSTVTFFFLIGEPLPFLTLTIGTSTAVLVLAAVLVTAADLAAVASLATVAGLAGETDLSATFFAGDLLPKKNMFNLRKYNEQIVTSFINQNIALKKLLIK